MIRQALLVLAFIGCTPVLAEDDPLNAPHVSLTAAQLIPVALKQFGKDQPKANKKHFLVYIDEREEQVEIAFIPESEPVTEDCGEKDCVLTMNSGGRTAFGFGITYLVDKQRGKIVKTIWSR